MPVRGHLPGREAGIFRSFRINGVPALSILTIPVVTTVCQLFAVTAIVRRVIAIAGNDPGEFARELQRNPVFAEDIRRHMSSTRRPQGAAEFD